MKRSFLIVLRLVIAFASLFVSCNDDNDIVNDDKEVVICNVSISKIGDGSVCFKDYSETAMAIFSGNTVTVIATPGESNFTGWFIGDSEEPVSTEATYTFVVTKNVSLVAKFNKWPSVSIRSGGNGTVSFKEGAEKSQYVETGDEVTVVATPYEKYEFIGWYIGDSNEPVSTEATYTFTVAENVILVAKFYKWPLVSIRSGGYGTVSFENSSELSQYIQIGDEVTIVAIPNEKCEFIGWFIGNSEEPVSTEATYTFTVAENITLVAKFNKWPLVSISSGGNGSVSFENSAELSQYIQIGEEVTVVATPNANCEFIGWFIGNSNKPVSTEATYTFTVEENVSLVAKFKTFKDGYEYVDLGLPSGLKWAAYNVGATKPEEYGGYYAWGETEEKENYSWSTYKWCKGTSNTMTKYCTNSKSGTVDNKTVLVPKDDVAHVNWGGDWRMPTTAEQDELRTKCTWQWTTLNGTKGYKVTGPNGNSIFLPAAGDRCGTDVYDGGYGDYWSGSLYSSGSSCFACHLYFDDYSYFGSYDSNRCYGRSVRAVCE